MFKWIRNKILKDLAKDVVKAIPTIKEEGMKLIEEHKDEVLENVTKAIKKAVVSFINSKINK